MVSFLLQEFDTELDFTSKVRYCTLENCEHSKLPSEINSTPFVGLYIHTFKCRSIWPREGPPVKHGGNVDCTNITGSSKFKSQVRK